MKAHITKIEENGAGGLILTVIVPKPQHPLGQYDPNHPYAKAMLDIDSLTLMRMSDEDLIELLKDVPDPYINGEKGNVRLGEAKRIRDAIVDYRIRKGVYNEIKYMFDHFHIGEVDIRQEVDL